MGTKGRDVNNPFEMLKNLGDMKDMKKILGDDFFKSIPFPQWQQMTENSDEEEETFPRLDLFERGQELIGVLEIPGIESPSEISLSVGPYSLVVKGALPSLSAREGGVHLSERHHGAFEREVEFPVRVDEASVKASYAQGLLTVRVTKYNSDQGNPEQYIPISFD
ncbi:Hsp20/alpha crystallin family protein [Alicyclobacillus curvatus]|nr:Hsp20/alpha crystallin family protein [Alicyclobacillus curvatus]